MAMRVLSLQEKQINLPDGISMRIFNGLSVGRQFCRAFSTVSLYIYFHGLKPMAMRVLSLQEKQINLPDGISMRIFNGLSVGHWFCRAFSTVSLCIYFHGLKPMAMRVLSLQEIYPSLLKGEHSHSPVLQRWVGSSKCDRAEGTAPMLTTASLQPSQELTHSEHSRAQSVFTFISMG